MRESKGECSNSHRSSVCPRSSKVDRETQGPWVTETRATNWSLHVAFPLEKNESNRSVKIGTSSPPRPFFFIFIFLVSFLPRFSPILSSSVTGRLYSPVDAWNEEWKDDGAGTQIATGNATFWGGGGMRKKRFKNRISPDSIRAFYQRQIADSVVK